MAYFQHFTRSLKLKAACGGKLFVRLCASAMCGRLSGRKANHMGFHAAFGIVEERGAKAAGFIVWVRSYTEQAKHLFSLNPSLIR
jgi:hypothetical protein